MNRGYFLTALGVVLLTAAGCDYAVLRFLTPPPTAETNLALATQTVAHLRTLSVGQTREEVLRRMGADPAPGCIEWSWDYWEHYLRHNGYLRCVKTEMIQSPYRTAALEGGGVRYEALFYYTGGISADGRITDGQVTPVLIGDGKLVGWGWDHPLVKKIGFTPSGARSPAEPQ
jgi:hypothetical protein